MPVQEIHPKFESLKGEQRRAPQTVDLLVDSHGGRAVMIIALTDRAKDLLDHSYSYGIIRAFGAHLAEHDLADLICRRSLELGYVVRLDGQIIDEPPEDWR
jgi:hypothetical protein